MRNDPRTASQPLTPPSESVPKNDVGGVDVVDSDVGGVDVGDCGDDVVGASRFTPSDPTTSIVDDDNAASGAEEHICAGDDIAFVVVDVNVRELVQRAPVLILWH